MATINNNVQNVKFLRNQTPFASHQAALEALNSNKGLALDGTAILARYTDDAEIKTLIGFVADDGTNKHLTIIDVEGSASDVEELRQEINNKLGTGITSANTATAQLAALSGTAQDTSATTSVAGAKAYAYDLISTLDYTDTAETGSYVSKVDEADGKISVTRVALPDASTVSGESKVVIDVTQDKGAITATAANLTGVKLDGLTAGTDAKIAATDTLGEALANVQAQIDAMDLTVVSGNGEVITAVSEADGKVSASKTAIKDVKLTGYVKDTAKTGDIAATDDFEDALSKIENNIAAAQSATTLSAADKSINVVTAATGTTVALNIRNGEKVLKLDNNATSGGVYTELDLVKITTGLPAEIKERYQLLDSDDTQIGTNIDIPKDSHIVSITYITGSTDPHYQNLEYVYIDVSGNTQTEYVDISELVLEAEFASGVTAIDHVVRGVVDGASEKDTQATPAPFLTVGADGFKVSGIKDEIDRKIAALDVTGDTAVAGQYVAAIEETDGVVAVKTRANVSEAVLNSYSKGSDATDVASTDTVNQAISKLENQIDAVEAAAAAAATVVQKDANASHLTVSSAQDATTSAVTYTIGESDIASKSDLDALSAKTITVVSSSNNSISSTTASTGDGTVAVDVVTDASKIKMSGFTAAQSGFTGITQASSVTQAVKEIETVFLDNEEVTANALNDLDGRLDVIESGYVETVKVNNVALAETNNAVNVQIEAATGATTAATSNAIVVNTDSNGKVTLGLNYIDCGTY